MPFNKAQQGKQGANVPSGQNSRQSPAVTGAPSPSSNGSQGPHQSIEDAFNETLIGCYKTVKHLGDDYNKILQRLLDDFPGVFELKGSDTSPIVVLENHREFRCGPNPPAGFNTRKEYIAKRVVDFLRAKESKASGSPQQAINGNQSFADSSSPSSSHTQRPESQRPAQNGVPSYVSTVTNSVSKLTLVKPANAPPPNRNKSFSVSQSSSYLPSPQPEPMSSTKVNGATSKLEEAKKLANKQWTRNGKFMNEEWENFEDMLVACLQAAYEQKITTKNQTFDFLLEHFPNVFKTSQPVVKGKPKFVVTLPNGKNKFEGEDQPAEGLSAKDDAARKLVSFLRNKDYAVMNRQAAIQYQPPPTPKVFPSSSRSQVRSPSTSTISTKTEPTRPVQYRLLPAEVSSYIESLSNREPGPFHSKAEADKFNNMLVECFKYACSKGFNKQRDICDFLLSEYPSVFKLTYSDDKTIPTITLPNRFKFTMVEEPWPNWSRLDAVRGKLFRYLEKKEAAHSSKVEQPHFNGEVKSLASTSAKPEAKLSTSQKPPEKQNGEIKSLAPAGSTKPEVKASTQYQKPPVTLNGSAQQKAPNPAPLSSPKSESPSQSDGIDITDKIGNRIRLIAEYHAVYSPEKSEIEMMAEIMARRKLTYELGTDQRVPDKFLYTIRIREIGLFECSDANAKEACDGVHKRTFDFIKNIAKLVDDFKAIYSPKKSPEMIVPKLIADNNEIMKITPAEDNSSTITRYRTTINLHYLYVSGSNLKASQREADLEAYWGVIEYLRKLAQIGDHVNGNYTEPNSPPPASSLEQSQKVIPKAAMTSQTKSTEMLPKSTPTSNATSARPNLSRSLAERLQDILQIYNSLPLTSQVNMFQIVETINAKQSLLTLTEDVCPKKNIPIYSANLDVNGIVTFQSAAYKQRDSLGSAGLKLIQFLEQVKELLKNFKCVHFAVDSAGKTALQIVSQLQVAHSGDGNIEILENGDIALKNIPTFSGCNADEAADMVIKFLTDLLPAIGEVQASTLSDDTIEELASLISSYDLANSVKSGGGSSIFEKMRQLGQEIAVFTDDVQDLNAESSAAVYRSVVVFGNIARFEAMDSDREVSKRITEGKAVQFLQDLSQFMEYFGAEVKKKSESQSLEIFCALLNPGQHVKLIEMYHLVESPKYLTVVQFNGIITFTGSGIAKESSVFDLADKFIAFFRKLNASIETKKAASADSAKQKQLFFDSLIRQYKSVVEANNSDVLANLEQLRSKGVFIKSDVTKEGGKFKCELEVGSPRELGSEATGTTEMIAKREAAQKLFNLLQILSFSHR